MSPCRCTSLVISMTTALCRRMRPSLVWENLRFASGSVCRVCQKNIFETKNEVKTTENSSTKKWKNVFFLQLEAEGPTWSLPYMSVTYSEHTTAHISLGLPDTIWLKVIKVMRFFWTKMQKCIPVCFAYIQDLRGWAFLSLFFSLCSLDPLVPHPGISEENLNSHIPHIPHIHTPSSMGRILSGRKWKRQRRQRKNWKNKDIKTSNSRPLLGRPKNCFFCLGMSQHVSTLNTSWLKSWLTEMWLSR